MAPCGSQGLGFGILANIRPSCTPYHAQRAGPSWRPLATPHACSCYTLEGVQLALASSNAVST